MATATLLHMPALSLTATPPLPPIAPRPQARRTTPVQGAALEVLGHAIEYLIDSRLHEGGNSDAEHQAVRMLMRCSRAVFEDCAVAVPLHQRVGTWLASHLRIPV